MANNPANTEVREGGGGDAPGALEETTVEQTSTLQTMENPTLEQVGKSQRKLQPSSPHTGVEKHCSP